MTKNADSSKKTTGRAVRLAFIPQPPAEKLLVSVRPVAFVWHKGMSLAVRQRSVVALHEALLRQGWAQRPLEVSTKSLTQPLGSALSSFKLTGRKGATVEQIFQSSKVFQGDPQSPYRQLLQLPSWEAKRFIGAIRAPLSHFDCAGQRWPLEPKSAFYDWPYLNVLALPQHEALRAGIMHFDAFTDIEFNQQKQINCQARAVALYQALALRDELEVIGDPQRFREHLQSQYAAEEALRQQKYPLAKN